MTAQQQTDLRRAHAASLAAQAKAKRDDAAYDAQQQTDAARSAAGQALLARIRRENTAHDRLQAYQRAKTMRQIADEQKQERTK